MLQKILRYTKANGWLFLVLQLPLLIAARFRNSLLSCAMSGKGIRVGRDSVFRGVRCIRVGASFTAGDGLWVEAVQSYHGQNFQPSIIIGDNVSISHWGHIAAIDSVQIGNGVLIGSNVIITDHNHGDYAELSSSPDMRPALRPLVAVGAVVIEDNVWLCDGVVVTPGARIGRGSVIGANSVVKGAIPPYTIATGAPAKVRKQYNFATMRWESV